MERKARRGGLVGPLVVIGLGLLFLLNNLGVVEWSVWRVLMEAWPLLLIAIGIDLLIGRRSIAGDLLVLILILAVFAGGFWLIRGTDLLAAGAQTTNVGRPLGGASRARIVLQPAAAELRVRALASAVALVEGTAQYARSHTLREDLKMSGQTAVYTLETVGGAFTTVGFGQRQPIWDVGINRSVPLELGVKMGAGVITLDLSEVMLEELEIDLGAGQTIVTLPADGRFNANVSIGIGQIAVVVPSILGVRLESSSALAAVAMPEGYAKKDNTYTSPNYAGAESRVDLKVGVAIGRVVIREE